VARGSCLGFVMVEAGKGVSHKQGATDCGCVAGLKSTVSPKTAKPASGTGKDKGLPTDSKVLHGIKWPALVRSEAQLAAFRALPCRADDVFVATYPKCGIHEVHKLCQLILKVESLMFPAEFNKWEEGPVWTGKGAGKGDLPHADIPAPRIVATHVPVDFLPSEIAKLGCRVVYVVREPKDVLVSYYHDSQSNPFIETPPTLEAFAEAFIAGASLDVETSTKGGAYLGGYATHVLQYVKAARAGGKIYLMSYDRLLENPHTEIAGLAKFLGADLDAEGLEAVRSQGSFASMQALATKKEEDETGSGAFANQKDEGSPQIQWGKGERGYGEKTLGAEQARRADEAFGAAFASISDVFATVPAQDNAGRGWFSCSFRIPGSIPCCSGRDASLK